MKKFWLFAGEQYYPYRALENLKGVYASREELDKAAKEFETYDWVSVAEVEDNKPVSSYSYDVISHDLEKED